ncbi:MAG: phytanoyl-CoA dioxygenase family protein [Planctomycetota bacterium]|nr:phytanoyl-CoA dioxygenase family protein [Planctomycetota bacterium]
MMAKLSESQRQFFDEQGYVVIPSVISKDACEKTRSEVWSYLAETFAIERANPLTWDCDKLHKQGFLDVFALDSMWRNRESEAVYGVFAELLDEARLWVSNDRVCWKRPAFYLDAQGKQVNKFNKWQRTSPHVHTDLNYWNPPERLELQGVLALGETPEERGGFACIPGFHKWYTQWAVDNIDKKAPATKTFVTFKDKALIKEQLVNVPVNAGDLLVFNSLLPHTTMPNRSDAWRMCQYITYFRAETQHESRRNLVLNTYQTGLPPGEYPSGVQAFQGRVSTEGHRGYQPYELSELGRKLVGAKDWA